MNEPTSPPPYLEIRTPSDWFADVWKFHRQFGLEINPRPCIPREDTMALRMELIHEEVRELVIAADEDDLTEIADAIGDLVYVALGMACSYGIDMRPVWEAIQESNMAKIGGEIRKDGKVMKPASWEAPDIAGVLKAQPALY